MSITKQVDHLFKLRQPWESLWDIAYRYIAPERSAIFPTSSGINETSIQDEVFDATAIDHAERLVNLLMSGLIPAWGRWFRLVPGLAIQDPRDQAAMRPALRQAEDMILAALAESNFYQEAQPAILDRVVGGTGALEISTNPRLSIRCIPLSELAIAEDTAGRISHAARKTRYDVASLKRLYWDKLPEHVRNQLAEKEDTDTEEVYVTNIRTPENTWEYRVVLKAGPDIELERSTTRWPRIIPTRWSKIAGTPYGRGPGLRALSDVRALNKLKEFTLKNAALATAGVFTVVADGVLNPHTMVVEPGAFIPVATNSPNEPSVLPLAPAADFNVANFSMDDLRSSIQATFMASQFQPLGRTPLSATEVAERTREVAQDMGASLDRLQNELLLPVLRFVADWLQKQGLLADEVEIGDDFVDVQFVSRMAQAQWYEDFSSLVEVMNIAGQMGQIDPRAALLFDGEACLRELANLRGVKPELMRSSDEIDDQLQMAQEMQQGEDPVGEGLTG